MSRPPTSFSRGRRWGLFFSVIVSIVAMTAIVIMLNYLGAKYYKRLTVTARSDTRLSPQTLGLLKSITNDVKVIVYFDMTDRLYDPIKGLLEEYKAGNHKISVEFVDYQRDAGTALQIKNTYKLGATDNKNLVIFDCGGKVKIVPGRELEDHVYERLPDDAQGERNYRDKLKAFKGEGCFSEALLNVTSPKPLTACFLEGDGEHLSENAETYGYQKFRDLLQQKYIQTSVINLLGTNTVPLDCDLLIIGGPRGIIDPVKLPKIQQYLSQGGRLFVLLNQATWEVNTGLEKILKDWGIRVGMNEVIDPQNTGGGAALVVTNFNVMHPIMSPLPGSSLELLHPRSMGHFNADKENPDAPKVEELAFTSDQAQLKDSLGVKPAGREVSLMATVEKGSPKGIFPERPATRILAVGDSYFLSNALIDGGDNRDFAGFAVNWLLGQRQFMQGPGSHPVTEWKLLMTKSQMTSVEWIFLAGMPGSILVLGGLVWLRRRH